MLQVVKRTDSFQGSDRPFVSFRPSHVGFNAVLCRLAKVVPGRRVKFFVDNESFKIGFRFHDEVDDPDSMLLSKQGKQSDGCFCSLGDLRNIPWIWQVCHLSMKQRRFEPVLSSTEQGKLWMTQICPAFENKRARESEKLPNEGGIYRYKRAGETVYIGRGNVAERAREPQRKEWDFDLVEYSLVTNPDEQTKWEYYWLERYKEEEGQLPIYNKISGARP